MEAALELGLGDNCHTLAGRKHGGVYSPVVAVEGIWMEGGVEEVWGEYISNKQLMSAAIGKLLLQARVRIQANKLDLNSREGIRLPAQLWMQF